MSEMATDVAPGTDDVPAPPVDPSAGTLNADTASGGPPESIPYGRFKEVNDQLREYKELEAMGYDPSSLMNLANWEIGFGTDPAGEWLKLAERIDGLPESVKAAVREAQQQATVSTGSNQGETPSSPSTSDEPPPWAQELIADKTRREQEAQARAESEASQQVLDTMLQQWNELDKQAGLVDQEGNPLISDRQKLNFIAGASGAGEDIDTILNVARTEAIELLEVGRKQIILPPGSPRSVPGGTSTPSAPAVAPKTLKEASAMAKADLSQGRLKVSGA